MNKIISLCSIISVLLLSGCAHYNARPLKKIAAESKFVKGEKSIFFDCKIFTADESTTYLGRDLISAGVQPLQIEFVNNSNHTFYVSKQSLNVPTLEVDDVAKLVHTDTSARVTWYSVAGLFLWPFFIPAIIDGISSATANRELNADFQRKAFDEHLVPKYTSARGIVFVPLEQQLNDLAFTVISQETDESFVLTMQKPHIKTK